MTHARSRSIRRELIRRMVLGCIVASLLVGAGTYLLERRRIADAIGDRAGLAVELLRASVQRHAQSTGEPWQQVLPRALAGLAADVPAAGLGRFVFVEILGVEGGRLASAEDASFAGLASLARQRGFAIGSGHIELAPIRESPVPGAVAISAPVSDRRGEALGRINGVFVVAPEKIVESERRLVTTVLAAAAIVIGTTLLIYPVVGRLVRRLSALSIHLLDANLDTLQVLGNAIAKRDSDTDAHNYRVTVYSVRLAEAEGVASAVVRSLVKGAFLHDVGKIGVRDHILLKPGRLTEAEFEIMKTHVTHGLDIVAQSAWLRDAAEVIGGHHEKYSGDGYHQGLRGAQIPLTARIFAIADVFDALTSERPYKKPMTVEESLAILRQGAGGHFDPGLVERFTTIAPDLHARFAGDREAARRELAAIVERYFRADLSVVLEDVAGRT